MTAVRPADVDRTIARLAPDIRLALVYGPDSGRARERAQAAVAAASDGATDDPFQVVRLDGDDVADQPGRLVDEASTYSLFGGRKVVWVRPTSRNVASAAAAWLATEAGEGVVVIEAGDLTKTSPLRTLCERSPAALALPCMADEGRDIRQLITAAARDGGFEIEADAANALAESLGGDRLATRSELDKLVLYCRGQGRISLVDVEAVISDVSALSVDAAVDAAFSGERAELEAVWTQHLAHGTPAATVLAAASRHALGLLAGRAAIEAGGSVEAAVSAWRGLFFRRKSAVERQLGRWTSRALQRVNRGLAQATELTRSSPISPALVTGEILFRIATFEGARQAADRSDRHKASS